VNYESKRITLSFPAVERLVEAYGLPKDLPSQTIAGYVERLIFEALSTKVAETPKPFIESRNEVQKTPNISKLAAMANKK
jgi:hypothetical protein